MAPVATPDGSMSEASEPKKDASVATLNAASGAEAKPVGDSDAISGGTTGKDVLTGTGTSSNPSSPVKASTSLMANPASSPPPSSFASHPDHRGRSVSNATTASSLSVATIASAATADSAYSTATVVPSRRQRDFEKLFGPQLRPFRQQERPDDFLTVLQTQSADLQASVLLHGRLYLTAYYLCFRSNIVGYVTEKMYDLRDIIVVERSTTAKWIQNAVSLTVLEDGAEVVVGYGSMGDREAMYEGIMEVWKGRAPERYEQYRVAVERREQEEKKAERARKTRSSGSPSASTSAVAMASGSDSSASLSSDDNDREVQPRASISTIRSPTTVPASASTPLLSTSANPASRTPPQADPSAKSGRVRAVSEVRHTQASGEKFEVEAIDTKIPIPMEQLYRLLYHNKEFGREFMEDVQGLTDVNVTEWSDVDGKKERRLKSVMHMNNSIGPKKSDCNSLERVEVEDPDTAYEVVSETQTPDIPSGKSFKIRTRTCLSHTGLDDNQTPATRLHCTTQCDWSASSMLKGAITPAVIKGQKEYHAKLVKAVKDWIARHPDDFGTGPPASPSAAGQTVGASTASEKVGAGVQLRDKADEIASGSEDDLLSPSPGASSSSFLADLPFAVWISALCALSLALNVYLLTGSSRC